MWRGTLRRVADRYRRKEPLVLKRSVLVVCLTLVAVTAFAAEPHSRANATTEAEPAFVPAVFPTVALDQTRGVDTTTNLVDDPGEWTDMGGGTDICTNPKATTYSDHKCYKDPDAPEVMQCVNAVSRTCKEVNTGVPGQKCKSCTS